MPTENNTGVTWNFYGDLYFLRDDEAFGICEYERYSLFHMTAPDQLRHILRATPSYRRIVMCRGEIDEAIPFFHNAVQADRFNRGFYYIDAKTVFLDERGQA